MPSTLATTAARMLDRLVDVVTGPVSGTVTATVSAGSERIAAGSVAVLADGRRVRTTEAVHVFAGYPAALPCRLEHLAPAVPAAQNFRPVPAATAATWQGLPVTVTASTTTGAFGPGALASGLKIGSLTEHDTIDTPGDLFAAGAQGSAALVLLSPSLRRIGPENVTGRGLFEATWRLRLALGDVAEQRDRRARARDAIDAIVRAVEGAYVGDDVVRIGAWSPVREPGWGLAWEATLLTRIEVEGRPWRDAAAGDDLTGADVIITLPGDGDAVPNFRELETINL